MDALKLARMDNEHDGLEVKSHALLQGVMKPAAYEKLLAKCDKNIEGQEKENIKEDKRRKARSELEGFPEQKGGGNAFGVLSAADLNQVKLQMGFGGFMVIPPILYCQFSSARSRSRLSEVSRVTEGIPLEKMSLHSEI